MSQTSELNYPKGPNDHKGILDYTNCVMEAARSYRMDVERAAMRNILGYIGMHWIRYDQKYRTFRPVALKKRTPRPVTNKFANLVNAICAQLESFKPPIMTAPGSQDPDDVAAGWAGEKILQVIEREADIAQIKPIVSKWLVLTGNAFLISNYDNSFDTGEEFIQWDRCVTCQTVVSPKMVEENQGLCPECGDENPEDEASLFELAFSPEGDPIGETYARGAHYTEVQSLFNCYFDYEVPFLKDSSFFGVSEFLPRESLVRIYGKKEMDTIDTDVYKDTHSMYLQSLAYTTAGSYRIMAGRSTNLEPRVRVRRIWLKPHHGIKKAKYGIFAVIAGETILDATEWKYHDERGDPFLNVAHVRFDPVPARMLGKTRCDDLIVKQYQRNRYESTIELHSRRMANSIWLLAQGMGVSKISGEQGHFLRYNAIPGMPPPMRVPGDNAPPYLIDMMMLIDKEMDDIMGTHAVSRGEVPEGVTAYSAIQFLEEKARQGQTTPMQNWSLGWLKWSQHNLDIWREYADRERILSSGGPGAWAIEKFSKAQLIGGVDLQLEVGDRRPTSHIARAARIEQAMRIGAINPMDPMAMFQVLDSLGVPELMLDAKVDLMAAHKLVDKITNGVPPPPPAPWDNHAIFASVIRRFIYSDQFENLPDELKMATVMRMNGHFIFMQGMQGQQAGQAAPGPPSAGSEANTEDSQETQTVSREAQGASRGAPPGGTIKR